MGFLQTPAEVLTGQTPRSMQAQFEHEKDRLKLLLDMTNTLVLNLELPDLLRAVSRSIRQEMHCDVVGVWLPDEGQTRLRQLAVDFTERDGCPENLHKPIDGSFMGSVFKNGKPVTGTIADFVHEVEPAHLACVRDIESVCALPLISRNRTLGVLALGSRIENSFSSEDIDFLMRAAGQIAIAVENALAFREIAELKDKLAQEKLYLEDEIRSEMNFDEIVGKSVVLRRLLKQVETVAPTGSTVLIHGETGSGKELVARALHNLSPRSSAAFVKLNCAALPAGLLESELFGHEKGAFTGAIAQRIGRFELGQHGTVFLDEIGEIPLELQPKLLRVLQEREFERLGSTRTLHTDARLIAATNRDLAAMVEQQKFRLDLFYRLNVFPLRVPPLRERSEDIPLLIRHFVQQFARQMNRKIDTIPSETMSALCAYHWPGNIRELQNVIERAVILSEGPVLRVALLDLKTNGAHASAVESPGQSRDHRNIRMVLEETERSQILAALKETHWVVAGANGAAVRLGMKRSTLQLRMRKLGIRNERTN